MYGPWDCTAWSCVPASTIGAPVLAVSLVLYARWNYGSLETLNIPVVKPHFLLGTTFDAHLHANGLRDIEWMKKYGPIYGVYEGREAQVHVNDIEMIRHIMVKDYEHFNARRRLEFGDPVLNEMPDFLPGEKWKVVRQLMSPQLTGGKVKQMSTPMNESMTDYVEALKKQVSQTSFDRLENYDLKEGIFTMTTDLILRCVFSIKVGNSLDSNNHFVNILRQLLSTGGAAQPTVFNAWALSFPFMKKFITSPIIDTKSAAEFVVTFKKLIETRRKTGVTQNDFTNYIMQLLEKVDTPEFKNVDVTELTLMCQALVFFFAGQDQITNISTFLAYFVAKNPDVEKKIVKELDLVLQKYNGKIDHECLSDLVYLNACINETLRFYPVFFRAERLCTKDWEMNGAKIKKGMTVIFPIWAANRNPKYFDDPETFDPERFMPYNKDKMHPYAFTSFGHGPRNCIGQRFSYEALLLISAHLFKNFQISVKEDAKIEFLPGNLFFSISKPINFDVALA